MTKRLYHMTLLVLITLILGACGAQAPPAAPTSTPTAGAPRERLSQLVERYWNENAAAGPWYSWGGAELRYGEAPADTLAPQALADSLARERRYLDDLQGMARAPLEADAKLTYDIFRRERELTIESFTFPSELLPVNGYDSVPQRFALMAAAAERHALASERDFEVWQSRALVFEHWTNQAILNLREGMRRGYTLPLPVVSRTLPVLAALAADAPSSVFYQELRPEPGTADDAERTRLRAAIANVVKDKILPNYARLHDFMQREYLPRARNSVGLAALPLGQAWYAYLVKRATDGVQTPADLHAQGVAEIDRLRPRLQAVLAETAFAGNAQGFLDSLRNDPRHASNSTEELLNAYQDLKIQVAAAAPTLFSVAPHADFEIRGVESFRTALAPALSYRRSLASGRNPAVLYVNTDLETRPGLFMNSRYLREAVPGHLFQLALQQERADLPRFRRFGGAPAFIEGWGLYAATLGEELGLYRDPEAKFGALLAQLTCAAGVVIDTGIHSQNWTRTQALDYLHAQVPLDEVTAANVVDRDLALPGDALSCMAGLAKLQSLRAHAQQTLGSRFDLQAFHAELLRNGAVPLDLLDAGMRQWAMTAAKQEEAPAASAVPAAVEAAPKLE